jgi:hypothetical protein
VRIVVDKVALGQVFFRVLPFSPVSIIPPNAPYSPSPTYTPLLPAGQIDQTGQTWETLKKMSFGNRVTLDKEVPACTL